MKQLRITVAGQTFEVSVETIGETTASVAPAPVAAPAPHVAAPVATAPVATPTPAPAPAAPAVTNGTPVPSPLAGKVVSLDVAVGTQVKEGDQIMTLEAMKMDTIIYAPASGTLTGFAVQPGQAVQEGQTLATLG